VPPHDNTRPATEGRRARSRFSSLFCVAAIGGKSPRRRGGEATLRSSVVFLHLLTGLPDTKKPTARADCIVAGRRDLDL